MKRSASMRRFVLLSCLLCVFLLQVRAQEPEYFKKNIKELSSEKYGGRGYYKDNDGKAAQYIADELAKWGAVPVSEFSGKKAAEEAGVSGWFQEITFPINDMNGKMDFSIDGKKMRPGYEYVIGSYSGAGKGTYPVCYLDLKGLDMNKILELLKEKGENKVVVMDMNLQYQMILPALVSRKLNLGGIIIRNSREVMKEMMVVSGMGEQSTWEVSPLMMNKMYMDFLQLPYPEFVVEKGTFPDGVKEVSFDIERKLNKEEKSANVIAVIPGAVNPDSIFVCTAHYDHLGMFGKRVFYPGANDNASGTAMLLSLARYYGDPANKPANTLVFVATTGEEMGLLGSRKFVDSPPFDLKKIKYVLNFDMVADHTDTLTTYSDNCGLRGYALMKRINEKEELFKEITYARYQQNSDHYPFLRKKIPAICFILEKGENFSRLHTPEDDIHHISYSAFPKLFTLVTGFIKQY